MCRVAQEETEGSVPPRLVVAQKGLRVWRVADVEPGLVISGREVAHELGADRAEGRSAVLAVVPEPVMGDGRAPGADRDQAGVVEAPHDEPFDGRVLGAHMGVADLVREDADAGAAALTALCVPGLDDGSRLEVGAGAVQRDAVAPDRDALVIDALLDLDHVAAVRVVDRVLDRLARCHSDRAGHSSGGKGQQRGPTDGECQESISHHSLLLTPARSARAYSNPPGHRLRMWTSWSSAMTSTSAAWWSSIAAPSSPGRRCFESIPSR